MMKIKLYIEDNYSSFNTGLFIPYYERIYVYFIKNNNENRQNGF